MKATVAAARTRLALIARQVEADDTGEMVYSRTTDHASGPHVIRCYPRSGSYGRYDNTRGTP